MKLAFEVSSLAQANPTGIARYIRNLTQQLCDKESVENPIYFYYKLSKLKRREHWPHINGIENKVYMPPLSPTPHGIDIMHGLDGTVPHWRRCTRVASIHDLLVLNPEYDSVCPPSFRQSKQKKYNKLIKIADAIITPSTSTRNDVIELLAVPEEKVFVVPHGIEPRFNRCNSAEIHQLREKYRLPDPFFLFVGEISSRKNIDRLIRAYMQSKSRQDFKLVLAGKLSFGSEGIPELIAGNNLTNDVIFPGYIADNDLAALYSAAAGFVFPTLYEGFGIPLLEAMACGTPVLSSNRGAAPEVCSTHGILVNPLSIEAIREGIDQLPNINTEQQAAAAEYAKSFTWQRCAQQTLKIYQKLI